MHKRMMAFAAAVSVTFGWAAFAQADNDDVIKLSMEESSCFQSDFSQYPYITFFGDDDPLTLSPFGETTLDWHITVFDTGETFEHVEGSFEWTIPGEGTLSGVYPDFSIDTETGAYTVKWQFTDGTGELEGAHGKGKTKGQADLATLCADFTFKGKVKVDD